MTDEHEEEPGVAIRGEILADGATILKNNPHYSAPAALLAALLVRREAEARGEVRTPPDLADLLARVLRVAAERAALEGDSQGRAIAVLSNSPAIRDPAAQAEAQREVDEMVEGIRSMADDPALWELDDGQGGS